MLSTHTIRAYARSLATFSLALVFAVATLPALAQQQGSTPTPSVPAAPYGYPYGHMMWGGPWGGSGRGPFLIFGPIVAVLVIIGLMAIFVWLVRWATHGHPFLGRGFHHGVCPYCGGPGRGRAALDILDERLAKGEIEKTEFEEKRKLLGR